MPTTRFHLSADQRAALTARLASPENWPHGTFHLMRIAERVRTYEYGYLHRPEFDAGKVTVYVTGFYEPGCERRLNTVIEQYPSLDALLDAGWVMNERPYYEAKQA